MEQVLLFALIGLGTGVVYGALGLGVVLTYRGTGVINFATGAMAAWAVYVYDELRRTGDLVLPVVGIPHRIDLGDGVPFAGALAVALLAAALIGLLAHLLVFRPLRDAPVLARIVASVGVMISMQALTVMHFGATPRRVEAIVPMDPIVIGGANVPRDRLILATLLGLVAAALWALHRFTTFGVAVRAGAENELAVSLARWSPSMLAGATWVLSSVAVSFVLILASPTTVVTPVYFTLAIVPALAAALMGRMESLGLTVLAGLALGSCESLVQYGTNQSWWPAWARFGLTDTLPLLAIVAALYLVGTNLPTRGDARADTLPPVARLRVSPLVIAATFAGGTLVLAVTSGGFRFGVITSMIVSILALSLVLLTGFIGQISLAQAAFAGAGGFALSRLASEYGVPFPLAPLLAAVAASVLGVLVAVPALRIRGSQLAVVTIATAVAIERLVFRNPSLTGTDGNPIPNMSLFGIDLAVRGGQDIARFGFGMTILVILTVVALGVANLARSATGRRFLAVRANERATAALGVSVQSTKLTAFAMSSFVAGIGGACLGYSRNQLSADSFTTFVGLSLLAFAYLGGITSVSGALVAGTFAPLGIVYVAVDRWLGLSGEMYILVGGIGLVLTAIMNPVGIAGAARGTATAVRRRGSDEPDAEASATDGEAHVPVAAGGSAPVVAESALGKLGEPSVATNEVTTSGPSDSVLEATGVSVRFGGVTAVDDVDLEVRRGQIVGLIGANGAGKTSFVDALSGFVSATGSVRVDGQEVGALAPHRRVRAGIGRTWQSLELFGELSVLENLLVACEPRGLRYTLLDLVRPGRRPTVDRPAAVLERLGIAHLSDALPTELSLGQQKLVGVARALVADPKVVLLDEPAAGLSAIEADSLGLALRDVVAAGTPVLLIDHHMGMVLEVCDYVYVLEFGKVIAAGRPGDVRRDPRVIESYLGRGSEELAPVPT